MMLAICRLVALGTLLSCASVWAMPWHRKGPCTMIPAKLVQRTSKVTRGSTVGIHRPSFRKRNVSNSDDTRHASHSENLSKATLENIRGGWFRRRGRVDKDARLRKNLIEKSPAKTKRPERGHKGRFGLERRDALRKSMLQKSNDVIPDNLTNPDDISGDDSDATGSMGYYSQPKGWLHWRKTRKKGTRHLGKGRRTLAWWTKNATRRAACFPREAKRAMIQCVAAIPWSFSRNLLLYVAFTSFPLVTRAFLFLYTGLATVSGIVVIFVAMMYIIMAAMLAIMMEFIKIVIGLVIVLIISMICPLFLIVFAFCPGLLEIDVDSTGMSLFIFEDMSWFSDVEMKPFRCLFWPVLQTDVWPWIFDKLDDDTPTITETLNGCFSAAFWVQVLAYLTCPAAFHKTPSEDDFSKTPKVKPRSRRSDETTETSSWFGKTKGTKIDSKHSEKTLSQMDPTKARISPSLPSATTNITSHWKPAKPLTPRYPFSLGRRP